MMQELQGPCMPYCLCSQRAALRATATPCTSHHPTGLLRPRTAAALPPPPTCCQPQRRCNSVVLQSGMMQELQDVRYDAGASRDRYSRHAQSAGRQPDLSSIRHTKLSLLKPRTGTAYWYWRKCQFKN